MAYMRDKTGRRLDDFGVAASAEINARPRLRKPFTAPAFSQSNTGQVSVYWPQIIDRKVMEPSVPDVERFAITTSTDHEGTHSNSGMFVMTGPSIAGPWTDRGRVYRDDVSGNQSETFTIRQDVSAGVYRAYYQQNAVSGATAEQVTLMATATNLRGPWTRVGIVVDTPSLAIPGSSVHQGYMRYWQWGGSFFGVTIGGGRLGGGNARQGIASPDGINWRFTRRMATCSDQISHITGYDPFNWLLVWTHMNFLDWRGVPTLIAPVGPASSGDEATTYRLVTAPLAPEMTRLAARVEDITPPAQTWEGSGIDGLGIGALIDGVMYIPYRAGGATGSIGILEVY